MSNPSLPGCAALKPAKPRRWRDFCYRTIGLFGTGGFYPGRRYGGHPTHSEFDL